MCRFPCKSGYCVSPLEIAAGQLAASQLVPSSVVKAILFPGACVFQASNGHTPIKVWKSLLEDYNMTDIAAPSADALPRLEVIILPTTAFFFEALNSCFSMVQWLVRNIMGHRDICAQYFLFLLSLSLFESDRQTVNPYAPDMANSGRHSAGFCVHLSYLMGTAVLFSVCLFISGLHCSGLGRELFCGCWSSGEPGEARTHEHVRYTTDSVGTFERDSSSKARQHWGSESWG